MFYKILALFFVTFYYANSTASAQSDSIKKIPYGVDFKFIDGVYLNFNQVKENSPIMKSRLITSIDYNDGNFYDLVLQSPKIYFFDNLGMKKEISVKSIWGYSKNGTLYIRMYDSYNKVSYVGTISHFLANIVINGRYNDPYYYNPYYYNRNLYTSPQYTSTELRQFIMDFDSGKIYDYDEENVGILLMKDPVLHDEYMGLSKKKKNQLKFFYIRKFNEQHPLLLPER